MPLPLAHRLRASILPVVAVAIVACGGGSTVTTSPDDTETAAPDAASLAPAGARSFLTFDTSLGRLVRVDPDTGQVDEVLALAGTAYAMDQGDAALWLGMDSGTVLRVNPADGTTIAEIAPTSTDGLFDLAVGGGSAWTLHGVPGAGTSLVRIDAAANTAGEPLAAADGISFYDIDADADGVWLVGSSPMKATTLYAVDPASGAIEDQEIEMVIDGIAAGDGAVWLAGTIFPDGAVGVPGVGRFDPATGELTTLELGGEPGAIAIGSGGVWAAAGLGPDGATLYRIDPATTTLVATVPLGEADSGRIRVSTGAGAVWVTTDRATYAVDPANDSLAGEADSLGTLGLYFP
jgi:DNA-binding beta-propeller fold protein YncE